MKRQTPRSTKTEMTRLCDEQDQPKGQKEEDEGENDGEEKEGGIKKKKKPSAAKRFGHWPPNHCLFWASLNVIY